MAAETQKINLFQRLVMGLFCLCFIFIFAQIVFTNNVYGYRPYLQIALMLCWGVVIALLCRLGARFHVAEILVQHRYRVLAVFLAVLFCVQCVVSLQTQQTLVWDYGKVVNGAYLYVQNPNRYATDFHDYFLYFNHWLNNAGEFALLVCAFTVLKLFGGLAHYYAVAIVLGQLLFLLAVGCTFRYVDKIFGGKAALFSLLLWCIFPVAWMQGSVAYTDTYSIWAVPAALCLWQRAKEAQNTKARGLFWAGAALVVAFGAQIKGSVWLIGIAMLCELILQGDWRRILVCICVFLLVFMAVNGVAKAINYALIWDEDMLREQSMPTAFWVMMGLSGDNGSYYDPDQAIVMVGGTPELRTQIAMENIRSRVAEKGVGDMLVFWHNKTVRTFGCGNAELDYTMNHGPLHPENGIYQFIFPEGRFYRLFNNVNQSVYLLYYVLALAGVVVALRRKTPAVLQNSAPFIALIGFYLFMLLWESNHRQLVNQWPLFIMAASSAALLQPSALWQQLCTKFKKGKQHE